ncbi:hypothetical protein B0O99DRAFT_611560 [Bisporella sp. PMI_857]|nr:hypothetical protein B0O99DRAFT_611560 [Bisporella sp. PMI_857]
METVSNLTSAASRAIWGDSTTEKKKNEAVGQEPISGDLGNVKAGEPYDKGNVEPSALGSAADSRTTNNETNGQEPLSGELGDTKAGEPYDKGNIVPPATLASHKPADIFGSNDPTSSTYSQKVHFQGAEHPQATPNSEELQAIKKTKNETETTAVTAVGPGPKPLEEIAQEREPEREPLSTGVKADGGDFDATRPNAGKESQRLISDEGHVEEDGRVVVGEGKEEAPATGKEGKEKVSLKDKIKAKLHKHKD